MPLRYWCRLLVAVVLLLGAAESAVAQELASTARGPRFLSTVVRGGAPLDASNAAVLQRRVSLDLTNVAAEAALDEIVRQARLELVYSKFGAALGRRVTVEVKNLTVAAALTEVLMGTGLDVLVSPGGQLALAKKAPERAVEAEPGAIVGRVVDAKSQVGLAGATVVVDGTSRSATTGSDGRYRIAELAPGTYTARARYIGYAPATLSVTVSADEEAVADLTLERSAQSLDQVVVTGTVIETEVKALPTPITVVTAEDIERHHIRRVDELIRLVTPGAVVLEPGTNSQSLL